MGELIQYWSNTSLHPLKLFPKYVAPPLLSPHRERRSTVPNSKSQNEFMQCSLVKQIY